MSVPAPVQQISMRPTLQTLKIPVCHQFPTLVPVLRESDLCRKSTVFTYEIGCLGMLRNRLWRCSLLFCKSHKTYQHGLSHTTGLLNSSALQQCLVRLKRSTIGREKRFSLQNDRKKYMAGSVQFHVHQALPVISERSVLLPSASAARIRMLSRPDAPKSPVVPVCADFTAKVDEEVWSEHARGSEAQVSLLHCTARVFQGYLSAPPSPALHVTTA